MRYSFHGKVRASGQQVDGFVEAANATEAIDRLADRGIIGVYSVRPEPKPVKNAVRLSGEAEPPEEEAPSKPARLPRSPTVVPRRIASAPNRPVPPPQPAAPAEVAPAPAAAVPAAAVVSPATEMMLLQVIEKLTTLMGRVEHALSRPMNVMYQAGPVRSGGFSPARSKSTRIPQDVQTSTLHDIFQNNLDLRKSLDKLTNTVNPPAAKVAEQPKLAENGAALASGAVSAPPNGATPNGAGSVREVVREASKPQRESAANAQKLAVQAQPV